MKAPIKKKLKKGERLRVGERAAANRATLTTEPSVEAVAGALSAPAAGSTTTVTRMTVSLESGVVEKAESHTAGKVESGVMKKVQIQIRDMRSNGRGMRTWRRGFESCCWLLVVTLGKSLYSYLLPSTQEYKWVP